MKGLRHWRLKRGFTQEKLAQRVGVTLRAYQAWESGESEPRLGHAIKLARILTCTVEDLWEEPKGA